MNLNTLGIIHEFLKLNVKKGFFCIDATCGRGRDTALLCSIVGNEGRVISFDIQQEAINAASDLLNSFDLKAELILDSHENMQKYAEEGTVDCIVFNFGRLPGGDPMIFTKAASSVTAISEGLKLLKPGGFMAIALYYGGPNGTEEKDAILSFVSELDNKKYSVLRCSWANRPNNPPIPIIIWKE